MLPVWRGDFHFNPNRPPHIYACKLSEKQKGELRVRFNFPWEQRDPPRNKMWFILSRPRREFHLSVTVRMPTRSMVHETASFYWHGIQSDAPGCMSLALCCGGGPPVWALPAPACIPIPFYAPSPHFQTCINTISAVKKGLAAAFLRDCFWLIMQSVAPSLPTSLDSPGVGPVPGDPPPFLLIAAVWPPPPVHHTRGRLG